MNSNVNDLTKYFVCKNCGNITLKKDAITIFPSLIGTKDWAGNVQIKFQKYCSDCIDGISLFIASEFRNYPSTYVLTVLEHNINELHPLLKEKIGEYFKALGCEYSTIEEALQYRDKIKKTYFQETLDFMDKTKVPMDYNDKPRNKFLAFLFGK